jgi:hypothetical protein
MELIGVRDGVSGRVLQCGCPESPTTPWTQASLAAIAFQNVLHGWMIKSQGEMKNGFFLLNI